ncbi:hypothetical protein ACWD04_23425 [Streptomyces sp. NPDC002911]
MIRTMRETHLSPLCVRTKKAIHTMTTEWSRTRRMVLRPRFSEDEVNRLAVELGWPRREEYAADPEEGTPYQVVWAAGPKLSLHYFEDDIARNSYVVVVGEDAAAVRGAAEIIEVRLHTWRLDELVAEVDSSSGPTELTQAVIRAGLGAPEEFDDRFFTRINDALRHSDTRVRESAVWSVSYVPYPNYRPQLVQVRDHDPDEDLRDTAGLLLEGFDEAGVAEQ